MVFCTAFLCSEATHPQAIFFAESSLDADDSTERQTLVYRASALHHGIRAMGRIVRIPSDPTFFVWLRLRQVRGILVRLHGISGQDPYP